MSNYWYDVVQVLVLFSSFFFIFFPSTNTDVFYALSGSFFLIASRSILLPIIFCFAFFFEIMFVCSSISTLKIGKFYKSSLHSFNLEQSKDNKNLHSLAHSVANNGIVFHIFRRRTEERSYLKWIIHIILKNGHKRPTNKQTNKQANKQTKHWQLKKILSTNIAHGTTNTRLAVCCVRHEPRLKREFMEIRALYAYLFSMDFLSRFFRIFHAFN